MPTLGAWPLRVLWVVLPVTTGTCFAEALATTDDTFRLVATLGLWALWAATLAVSFVPVPVTLTMVRIVAPAGVAAVGWATLTHGTVDGACGLALVTVTGAAIVSLLAPTGDVFVDGASYGPERRFALLPPAPLLIGPIELAWVAVVVGSTAGPILLATRHWWLGGVVLLLGIPVAAIASTLLHGLSRRWIVFVPAGLVVHDPMTLRDALLVPSRSMGRLGVVPGRRSGRRVHPPTWGTAVEIELTEPVGIAVRRGEMAEAVEIERLAFSPSLPGRLLQEARTRQMPVS